MEMWLSYSPREPVLSIEARTWRGIPGSVEVIQGRVGIRYLGAGDFDRPKGHDRRQNHGADVRRVAWLRGRRRRVVSRMTSTPDAKFRCLRERIPLLSPGHWHR